ncbi:hypothetical protein NFC73_01890 [Pseudarthrobacter sp. RMG13]|uniref:SHOCT domain-containing protein n=1 Tax=Pseudarthrobacter humi TaxID=2952523 RepID=A0ABT1LJ80_9MICC|nr:hypothetical protein [Pseudarthrobacter humi]MCP8998490.1 hypothetical protein [Pseudarthrobacter humi]
MSCSGAPSSPPSFSSPAPWEPEAAGSRAAPRNRGIAENLLAERFARGEIDENEYTARLTALRRARGER